jgi:hypothetical protein
VYIIPCIFINDTTIFLDVILHHLNFPDDGGEKNMRNDIRNAPVFFTDLIKTNETNSKIQEIIAQFFIHYISHQYQDLLYCNTFQHILSTYNSQHNNNNNVVLAMTMPYSGIVIANTTLLYE